MPSSKSSSPKRGNSSHRSQSKSPNRRSKSKSPSRQGKQAAGKKSATAGPPKSGKSAVSQGKKSMTSAKSTKSVSSIQSRLLSAKKGSPDDNKPKKVIIKSPDLAKLNLRTEDLSFSGLTQLPHDTFTAEGIGVLDISGNNLRAIPADICKLTELRALNLSQNSIKCSSPTDYSGLPKELARLKHLEIVAISECNLRYVPAVVFECIAMKRLDVSRNKFQMLPPDVGNLVDLEYLNVSETSIKSLPPEIAFCERLKELNLYGNILELLPETMRELHELTELKLNARSFHAHLDEYMNKLLRNGQIKSEHIPSVLFDIPELRTLDLDGTRINNLPEENSCKLEDLYLSNNYFLTVPKGLKTLPYLVMVDMSHNFLTSIPEDIPDYLPSIRVLRLNFNLLTSLPNNLSKLITLEELEISNNKIAQLPPGIGNLTQLQVLRAANNRIHTLPDCVCNLLDLETLELTNNRLSELPVPLFNLTKIRHMHIYSHMKPIGLWLHKNPITVPPEVIWKGVNVKPLNQYLRRLQIRRTENLQPVKLIYLGEKGSGKTTLNKSMITGKCEGRVTEEEEMSHTYLSAAEISNLMKRLPRDALIEDIEEPNRQGNVGSSTCVAGITHWQSDNGIRFCSMDLGGDNVYRVLHEYFLDKDALFVLAYDHRKFTGHADSYHSQIGYWLDLLNLHVPGAVVKVVGTHCDMTSFTEEIRLKVKDSMHKHMDEYKAYLATELVKLTEKIEKTKQAAADGSTQSQVSNLAEFDPMANILQLEYQAKQMRHLLDNPLKIQPDISLVNCVDGVEGLRDLKSDIEMLAINKELIPVGQRYIPASWQRFRAALKKKPGFKLPWKQIKELGEKFKIHGEVLGDAVEYIHNCGDVLWLQTHHKLKDTVFHKPLQLIEALRGIIHHNLEHILNFDENKSFSSIGKLSHDQFVDCKQRMLEYGEISRQLLLGLWYYLPTEREEFIDLYELMGDFDLAYLVPQSDIPTSHTYCEPLLVVPWYVKVESSPSDIGAYWSSAVEEGRRELEIVYTFTQQFPEGLFERLSTQLQGEAVLRIDWANTIYIETAESQILVKRYINVKTLDINVSIQVRSEKLRGALQILASLHQTWTGILTSIPGLLWKIANYTARKHSTGDKPSMTPTTPLNSEKSGKATPAPSKTPLSSQTPGPNRADSTPLVK